MLTSGVKPHHNRHICVIEAVFFFEKIYKILNSQIMKGTNYQHDMHESFYNVIGLQSLDYYGFDVNHFIFILLFAIYTRSVWAGI